MHGDLVISDSNLELVVGLDPLESAALGFEVASVKIFEVSDLAMIPFALKAISGWVSPWQLITARVEFDQKIKIAFLQALGFSVVDMSLKPKLELQDFESNTFKITAEIPSPNELAEISDIASICFKHGRFHGDTRISNELANQRYRFWVNRASASGKQELLAIKDENNLLLGFFVRETQNEVAYWHLTAISPKFQGRGVGEEVWNYMIGFEKAAGMTQIVTSISVTNTKVLNLYSKLDFKFTDCTAALNLHRSTPWRLE